MNKTSGKLLLFQPTYINNFSCIGPACEDNCCYGWRIKVDKTSYEKYMLVDDCKLKSLFQLYLVEDKNSHYINHQDNVCPFFNQDKLCMIHKHLGEDSLCDTCTIYPRTFNILNEAVEVSGSVSCPEIARLVLANKDGIDFEYSDDFSKYKYLPKIIDTISNIISIDDTLYKDNYIKYLWNIRNFCIDIIQNSNNPLDSNLILLGLFIDKINSLVNSNEIDKIPDIIKLFSSYVNEASYSGLYKQNNSSYSIKFIILLEVLTKRAYNTNKKYTFNKYYSEFLKGLDYSNNKSIDEIMKTYNYSYTKYFKPFFDNHRYVFENYLVNYIFRTLFPLDYENEIFKQHILLAINYSLLKFLLVGIASFHKGLNEDIVIKVIQSYAKVLNHNNSFINNIYQKLKDRKMDNIKYSTVFIID